MTSKQAQQRVTGDSKGSGLGLAIVKTIVETNGGRIWVNSIYGKGSSFAFTLPKYLGEIDREANRTRSGRG